MTKDEFDKLMPLKIPQDVAVCPICGAGLFLDELSEWTEPEPDKVLIDDDSSIAFNCETEPDIDGPDWWDWHHGHWSTPYIDWLPLERSVKRWLADFLLKQQPVEANP